MTGPFEQVWEQYVASWKAPSIEEKRALFEGCLDPRCVYTDPIARVEGWEALVGYMLDFQRQVPGVHFVTEEFFAHHDRSAARWVMRDGDGRTLGHGISAGEYERGRLVAMTGFFDVPGAD